jgi:hypothetical protein
LTLKNQNTPRTHGGFFSPLVNLFIIVALFLTWQSCEEPHTVGLDLIDDLASYSTTDTVTLSAFTLRDDSIPTNLGAQNLLGVMVDPVFGKVRASIYTQFRLPQNNFSLGEDPELDSIKLFLGYTGRYYGDLQTFQTISVYELSEHIPDVDTLYSNRSVERFPDPIGSITMRPNPTDSVMIDTIAFPAHFVIPLSMEFGQKIVDANDTEYFENIPNFLDYFKGLYIGVDDDIEEGGSIFNINMYSPYTVMRLYYRNPEDTVSRFRNFRITEFTKRMTHVETFDFEMADPVLKAQVLEEQTQLGDSLLFVQSLGTVRADIRLPHIEKLAENSDVVINQARLVIPADTIFTEELFPAAQRLLLFRYDDDGEMQYLSDFNIGSSYFGGSYDATKKQYSFNITQHLQRVLNGELANNGLTLVVSGAAENAERIVLRGPGRAENAMRLELIYTIFD